MALHTIARYLQHFPYLESFTLTANCDEWSDYDKQKVLSTIFAATPARDVKICFGDLWWSSPLQFDDIIKRHKEAIRLYKKYNSMVCMLSSTLRYA